MLIDAVITWVDGADPAHAARRAFHARGSNPRPEAVASTRFTSSGELRFTVRSLLRFLPSVRRIHVVTDDQHPHPIAAELAEHPTRVAVVPHRTIFAEHADLLPVFSSRSIETMIHRIPDLAERFLYLNDDIFIGRPMTEADFFDGDVPVLRGTMRRFPNPVMQRLRKAFDWERPGYGAAQRAAARLVGRRRDYLLLEHQPSPMCRSTLATFYAGDQDALRRQAGHRFRSVEQVSPIGLSAHLELAAGAPIAPPVDVGYVRPGRPSGEALRRVMSRLQEDAFASFCVQSLDAMSTADRDVVLRGLEERYT